jgi:hypothetical protein
MIEERRDNACAAIQHCERMFAETQNPYYIVMALAAARSGDFEPPEWALDELLRAVSVATFRHNVSGARISIDAALGLAVSRGKAPKEREAHKHDADARAFDLARTIHACFEVSIPDACEIAYYAIDLDFARLCEEYTQPEPLIEASEDPDVVKDKMRAGKWWTITHGDRLGYSLDQFIDRYYRLGTRGKGPYKDLPGKEGEFFEGSFLLLSPERCTREITLADIDGGIPRSKSAVANLPKRPDFKQFEAKLSARVATVSKSPISAQ